MSSASGLGSCLMLMSLGGRRHFVFVGFGAELLVCVMRGKIEAAGLGKKGTGCVLMRSGYQKRM